MPRWEWINDSISDVCDQQYGRTGNNNEYKRSAHLAASRSMRCEPPVDWERNSDHEARSRAAKPENGRRNLVRSAEPTNRLIPHYLLHRLGLLLEHVRYHRGIDRSWADRIDANAPRGIFERGAPGKADHTMLGRMVGCPSWQADKPAKRGAVDDCAAALLTHVA